MGSTGVIAIPSSISLDHIVIFPFLSKGHVIPLLHLATNLSSKGIKVTLITTQANSSFFHGFLDHLSRPNIHIRLIPFPDSTTTSLPEGVESTDQLPSLHLFPSFVSATTLLDRPFREAITFMVKEDGEVPLCVISDFFCGWTLKVCQEFKIPRLVFHGFGVFSILLSKSLILNQTHVAFAGRDDEFHVPGTPETLKLTYSDVPESIQQTKDDQVIQFLVKNEEDETNSWGVLVNSFVDVDEDYIEHLESFFSGKVWLVGPLCLYSPPSHGSPSTGLIEWLGTKRPRSVVYVSFGTMVVWPEEQLEEIWYGLETSGYDYLWVERSPTWESPVERSERGFIHKDWAPQREILRHPSVGGFMSHCGWNSVLESVTSEVPILAWPVMAEQSLNAKFVVDVLGVGIRLTVVGGGRGRVVGREMICDGVRELMGGEDGKRVKANVAEKARAAKAAVGEGGSSFNTVDKLLQELNQLKQKVKGLI